MDINSFDLEKECFGFDNSNRSSHSNMDFMYFVKVEDSPEYKKLLRDFNEAKDNIMDSNLPAIQKSQQITQLKSKFDADVAKLKRQQGVSQAAQTATTIGNLFQTTATALGIKPKDGDAPVSITPLKEEEEVIKEKEILFIVGGVVLIGAIAFFVLRKK